jgi:hypothetical protein
MFLFQAGSLRSEDNGEGRQPSLNKGITPAEPIDDSKHVTSHQSSVAQSLPHQHHSPEEELASRLVAHQSDRAAKAPAIIQERTDREGQVMASSVMPTRLAPCDCPWALMAFPKESELGKPILQDDQTPR